MTIRAVPLHPLPTEPPEGWRFLVKGEKIQEGDKTYNVLSEMWHSAPDWMIDMQDIFGGFLRVPPIRKIEENNETDNT